MNRMPINRRAVRNEKAKIGGAEKRNPVRAGTGFRTSRSVLQRPQARGQRIRG